MSGTSSGMEYESMVCNGELVVVTCEGNLGIPSMVSSCSWLGLYMTSLVSC